MTKNDGELWWHYTSAANFTRIFHSPKSDYFNLWGSDCTYLNDWREYEFGKDIVLEYAAKIEEAAARDVNLRNSEVYKKLKFEFDWIRKGVNHFVICFSGNGDLLSQWYGYAGGSGVAIGVDPEQLPDRTPGHGLVYANKVLYGEASARTRITDIIKDVNSHNTPPDDLSDTIPFLKDESFAAEEEHRLVFWPTSNDLVLLREVRGSLVPYVSLEIPYEAVVRIRVAPRQDPQPQISAIERIVSMNESMSKNAVEIVRSKGTLR